MEPKKVRRHDLDWLRVLVFSLLIFYHVGMFFVPWGWHLKNSELYEWIELPMLFVNQWRLSILFVISGMGTCFAMAYRSRQEFIWERLKRLGLPLLFGIVFIVPPQVYVERLVDGSFQGNYGQFYFSDAFKGIYPSGNISWHHLWFLPYLLLFSILLSPTFLYFRNHPNAGFINWCEKMIQRPFGLYVFILPLYLTELLLAPLFPVTHALIDDWFIFTNFLVLFFYGYLFIRLQAPFWEAINRIKFSALLIGTVAFFLLWILWGLTENSLLRFVVAFVKVVNCWSWIIVLFGYSAKYLNRKSALLAYCNTAVYPFYIFHQTITIILGYFLRNKAMSFGWKFGLMSVGTFLISWGLYEFIRRINWLRPLFGLKKA